MDWTLPVTAGALGVGASRVSPQLGLVLVAQMGICIQVPVSYCVGHMIRNRNRMV